jgi:hypothetical protein
MQLSYGSTRVNSIQQTADSKKTVTTDSLGPGPLIIFPVGCLLFTVCCLLNFDT